MKSGLTILSGFILAIMILSILVLLNGLVWGCLGWFIGLFFGDTILGWLAGFGIENITMFQLFAIIGVIKCLLFSNVSLNRN